MYTLERAVLREKGLNKLWTNVDISNMTLPNIFKKFHSGYIVLSTTAMDHLQYVDFLTLKSVPLPINTQPFAQWLTTLGNTKLPATEKEPEFVEGTLSYIDVWSGGYTVRRCNPSTGLPSNTVSPLEQTDALITKDGMPNYHFASAVITVNGLMHRSALTAHGLQVQQASRSLDISQTNKLGLLSFSKLGTIKILGIEQDQIQKNEDRVPLYKNAYVSLGMDLTGKSIVMSLGGYFNSGGIEIINPTAGLISLDMQSMNLRQRIMESLDVIDLKDLDLEDNTEYPGSVSVPQIIDDWTIRKYLTISQTFFIVIDAPALGVGHEMVDNVKPYGLYECTAMPTAPLIDHLGRLPEYVRTQQGDVWVLRTGELYSKDYNYETAPLINLDRLPPQVYPAQGYHKEIGTLLIMRSQQLAT